MAVAMSTLTISAMEGMFSASPSLSNRSFQLMYGIWGTMGAVFIISWNISMTRRWWLPSEVRSIEYGSISSSRSSKVAQDIHFEASSLPRWDKNADSHDAVGKPRFGSKKAVDEYLAKSEGDWVYD